MNEEWKRRDREAKSLFYDEKIRDKGLAVLVFRERLNLVNSVDELKYVLDQAREELKATELSRKGTIDSVEVLKNILSLDRPFKIIYQLDSINDIDGLINLSVYTSEATKKADATSAARLTEINKEIWTKIVSLAADKLKESNIRIREILHNKDRYGAKVQKENKRKQCKTELESNIFLAERIIEDVDYKNLIGETINTNLLLLKDELKNSLELYGPDSIQSIKNKIERFFVEKLRLRPKTAMIVGIILIVSIPLISYLPNIVKKTASGRRVAESSDNYKHLPGSVLVRIVNKSDKAINIDEFRYALYLPDEYLNYGPGSFSGLRGKMYFMPILTEKPFDPGVGYPIVLAGHRELILEVSLSEEDRIKLDKTKETILEKDGIFLFVLRLKENEEYAQRGLSFKEHFLKKKMIVFEIEPK